MLLAEHRLEEVFPLAHKAVLMDKARIFLTDTPRNVGNILKASDKPHKMLAGLPSGIRIFGRLDAKGIVRLPSEKAGSFWKKITATVIPVTMCPTRIIPKGKRLWKFQRAVSGTKEICPMCLTVCRLRFTKNEILCILGGNGAGKTTMLRVMSGISRLYSGKLRFWGKKIKEYAGNSLYRKNLSSLPQNPQTLFVKSVLKEDLKEAALIMGYSGDEAEERGERGCAGA